MADRVEGSASTERFLSGNDGGVDIREKIVNGSGSDSSERGGTDPSSSQQEPAVSERSVKGKAAAEGASAGPEGIYRGFCPMPIMENWPFNPSMMGSGFDFGTLGHTPLVPVLLPAPLPGYCAIPGQDSHFPLGGVFSVPVMPLLGSLGSIPQGGFVPLSFNMPPIPPPLATDGQAQATTSSAARPTEGVRDAPRAHVRDVGAPDGLHQRHVAAAVRQPQEAPRPGEPQIPLQVVRRFQVGFQLDLLLILKLAVVVIVFNQDGTKDRLMLLLLLAGFVYLYQTGALAPILRWISQCAQRAMMPPLQPVPGADVDANAEGVGVAAPNPRNVLIAPNRREETQPEAPVADASAGLGEGAPGAVGVDEPRADQPPEIPNWWGIIKELQMIFVGFLTSLLPGFHHVE